MDHKEDTMQRIFGWLSRRRWFVSLPIIIVAGVVAYLGISSLLDWANSTGFCGTICHNMRPEYTAYQQSFHARVRCAECHVGPGLLAEVEAKWEGVRELYMYVTNTYEKPIPSPVESLRPARETCEQCHWPEVFYSDRAVDIPHFAEDKDNTRTDTYMLVKIGGGTARQGQGRGIHWHIENVIQYIATDPQRQSIPWVQAQIDGQTVTFVDTTQPLPSADLQKYTPRVMDCIDCHNRATHIFRSATQAVEQSMANGLLPTDLPYLRQKAVEVMDQEYASQDAALAAIAGLADWYRANYNDIYGQRPNDITRTVAVLQGIYRASHFPEYKVDPTTYPDNIGHDQSPGCFRCHDGKHLTADGSQSIRLHCNICHTIPQTVAAGQPAPAIPFQPGMQQPQSHLASNWMAQHRNAVDQSCSSCHQVQTFCANPNCHGRSWPYVNLER
jgi:nitrate/TMAO reductase-like tetraheme cytochrome c subunit